MDPKQSDQPQLRLILMRHAKSDWGNADLSDHDRSLNERGRHDAPRMASWLAENEMVPDLILCSSACRTRETSSLMLGQWGTQPHVFFSKRLYLSTPQTIFSVINEDAILPNENPALVPTTVMVLAHNPGISEAAGWLMGQMVGMPTAALVAFDWESASWSETIDPKNTRPVAVMKPKGLGDGGGWL